MPSRIASNFAVSEDAQLAESNAPTVQTAAQSTAERLFASGLPPRPTPEAAATGAEQVFADLFRNLSQWVGAAGCLALFNRALVLSTARHVVFQGVRYRPQGEMPHLERFAENARECGGEATVEGVTAVLTSIITMLSGLIGDEDITMSLLEDKPPAHNGASGGASDFARHDVVHAQEAATGRRRGTEQRQGHDRRHGK